MKTYIFRSFILACTFSLPFLAGAQFDDIYFDPEDDQYYSTVFNDDEQDRYVEDKYNYDKEEYYYDDDEYDYYDDYDFYYSSRIRRFNRPFTAFDFFDPFYFDPFYYGVNLYAGNSYFGFGSSWNRWNRGYGFNAYDYNWHSRHYNRYLYAQNLYLSGWYPYNAWNYCPSYGLYGGYGYGSIYGNSFYNRYNYYGGRNIWGYPNQPVFDHSNPNGYYYGTRRGGSITSPPPGVSSPRSVRGNVVNPNEINRNGVIRTQPNQTDQGIRRAPTGGDQPTSIRTSPRVTKTYTSPRSTDQNQTRLTPRAVTPNRSNSISSPSRRTNRTYTPSGSSRRTYTPSGSGINSSSRKSYTPSRSSTSQRSYSPRSSGSNNKSYSPASPGRSSIGGSNSSGSSGRSTSGGNSSSGSSGSSRTSPRG